MSGVLFGLLTGCMMSGPSAVRGGSGSAASTVFRPLCLSWPSAAMMRHLWKTLQWYVAIKADCKPTLVLFRIDVYRYCAKIGANLVYFLFYILPFLYKNRLQESVELFTSICTSAVFESTSLVSLFCICLSRCSKNPCMCFTILTTPGRLCTDCCLSFFFFFFLMGGRG